MTTMQHDVATLNLARQRGRRLVSRGASLGASFVAAVLTTFVAWVPVARAEAINMGPTSDPVVLTGTITRTSDSKPNCETDGQWVNYTLTIRQEDIGSLRVQVSGSEDVTLLVVGPGGRFCLLPTGGVASMLGYWSQGTYQLMVSKSKAGSAPYRLEIKRS